MNKKILAVAMLGLVVLAVSSSGCTFPWPTPSPPDLRMPSSLSVTWLGGDSMGGAGLKVSGKLLDPSNNGIADKQIVFYGSNDASFNQPEPQIGNTQQVQLQAQTTDSQGRFAFTLQSKGDKYLLYSVMFNGDVNLAGNYKPSASTVGGYRALNVIANQLRNELLKLPENVFAQAATKGQLLSTLGVFKLMVGSGHYSAAATTLDNGFLKRTDGYATSGSGAPDANDLVRTEAAQNQLYSRAYTAVQDCQWLSGGSGYLWSPSST